MVDIAGIAPVGGRSAEEIAERLIERASLSGADALSADKRDLLLRFARIDATPTEAMRQISDMANEAGVDAGPALNTFATRLDALSQVGVDAANLRFSAGFGRRLDYYSGFIFEASSQRVEARSRWSRAGVTMRFCNCSARRSRYPVSDAPSGSTGPLPREVKHERYPHSRGAFQGPAPGKRRCVLPPLRHGVLPRARRARLSRPHQGDGQRRGGVPFGFRDRRRTGARQRAPGHHRRGSHPREHRGRRRASRVRDPAGLRPCPRRRRGAAGVDRRRYDGRPGRRRAEFPRPPRTQAARRHEIREPDPHLLLRQRRDRLPHRRKPRRDRGRAGRPGRPI